MDVIRFVGGLTSDGSQTISGMLVRSLGGTNIGVAFGLGALGKVSIGDNQTLSKLVETTVEVITRRTTEAAVSSRAYDRKLATGAWGWISIGAKP